MRARVVGSPADADRILIGVCAVIWLVLLGTGVAAVVALVNLGTGGHSEVARSTHTPWALYIVAVVSALVILAAIPVLLRARQGAAAPPPVRRRVAGAAPVAPGSDTAGSAITEKLRVFDPAASSPAERVWLRGSVLLAIAVGVALIAVAIATNLMAVGRDALSWGSYGVAALITVAMPVIPWLYLRQLHAVLTRERN